MQRMLASLPGLAVVTCVTLVASIATLHAVISHTLGRQHWLESPSGLVSTLAFGGLLALGLLAVLPLAGFLAGACRLWRAHRLLHGLVRGAVPTRVGGREVWRLSLPGLACFVAGTVRQRIFVSPVTLNLEPQTREAALLHEEAHLRQRAPLRRSLLSLFAATWWFIPAARQLAENESVRLEVEADDDALRSGAGRRPLFDAIVQAATLKVPSGAGLATVAVGPRLERLAGTSAAVPKAGGGLITLVVAAAALSPLIAHFGVLLSVACF
jgi:hypothetical protein